MKYSCWDSKTFQKIIPGTSRWSSRNRQASRLVCWESARAYWFSRISVLSFSESRLQSFESRLASSDFKNILLYNSESRPVFFWESALIDSLQNWTSVNFWESTPIFWESALVDSLLKYIFCNFLRVNSLTLRVGSSCQQFWKEVFVSF